MHFFDLSHFSILKISGSDARDFLHAQVTCDLSQLDKYGWLPGAWCIPNGRVLATFFTYRKNDDFYLITPGMLKEKIINRLSMFILRSDVTISDESDNMALMGWYGEDSIAIVENSCGKQLQGENLLLQDENTIFLEMPDANHRFIICCEMDDLDKIMNQHPDNAIEGNRSLWSLLDIEAGIPWIINSTSEQYLPQMLNLDEMHGLSFSKGCYPGQEIIARVHYRGQLKKKMYLGKGKPDILPGPGDRLLSSDSESAIGDIIDAEFNTDREIRFLAVVEIAHAQDPSLYIRDDQKTGITLDTLSYSR